MAGPLGLGTAPNSSDANAAKNFAVTADAFFRSLSIFEKNLADYGNGVSLGFVAASTTTLTVPNVTSNPSRVTLDVGPNKGFAVGMPVMISSQTSPTAVKMLGTVVGLGFQTLTVEVQYSLSVGTTLSSWSVAICGPLIASLLWTYVENASGTNLDCSKANYFYRAIGGNTTFSFSNIPSGQIFSFIVEIYLSYGAITWPTNVVWPNNSALVPNLYSMSRHLFIFWTHPYTQGKIYGSYITNYQVN